MLERLTHSLTSGERMRLTFVYFPETKHLVIRYSVDLLSIFLSLKIFLIKATVLQNILKIISYILFKISLQIYKVVRNKIKTYIFSLLCFENRHRDNSLFCHREIYTINNGYCVSNAVDYAKKNDVLPTIYQLN